CFGVEEPPTVGEGVGGDVHDAHDSRSRPALQNARTCPPRKLHRVHPRPLRYGRPRRTSSSASVRVLASERKTPRTAEVTVVAPAFLTPRIVMHRCSASMRTNTPLGSSAESRASAISV